MTVRTFHCPVPLGMTEKEEMEWNDKGPWMLPGEQGYDHDCDPMNDFDILMIDF